MEMESSLNSVRIDVWLWAARFFKTRVLAKKACDLGRVRAHGQPVKPSRNLHIGERVQITTEGGEFEVDVLQLSELRGPAPTAQALYRETETSKDLRAKAAEERKANRMFAPAPTTRPSKRDRRRIIQFREKRSS
jgi:ribosome-associated heat shock protein Hsp15